MEKKNQAFSSIHEELETKLIKAKNDLEEKMMSISSYEKSNKRGIISL